MKKQRRNFYIWTQKYICAGFFSFPIMRQITLVDRPNLQYIDHYLMIYTFFLSMKMTC